MMANVLSWRCYTTVIFHNLTVMVYYQLRKWLYNIISPHFQSHLCIRLIFAQIIYNPKYFFLDTKYVKLIFQLLIHNCLLFIVITWNVENRYSILTNFHPDIQLFCCINWPLILFIRLPHWIKCQVDSKQYLNFRWIFFHWYSTKIMRLKFFT